MFAAVDAVGKVLAFAVVALLTRRESPHTFGVIVAGISAAAIVQCVVDGGLGMASARAVAREDSVARVLTGSKVIIAIGTSVPCVAVPVIPRSGAAVPLATLACGATGALLLVPALLAAQKVMYASVALIGPNVLLIALIVVLPVQDAASILFLFALCNCFCALLTLGAPEVRPSKISPVGAARLYRRNVANGVYTLVTTVYGRMDTVMLAAFGAVAAAGVYGTYFRMVLVAVGLISWITPLALRLLTEPDLMQARVIWLEKRLAGMAVAASLGLVLLGPWLLGLVTNGGSLPLAAFLFLGLLPVPTVMSAPLASAMLMSFRSQRLARIATYLLGVASGLYVVLIPLLGSTGAALGSLTVEILALVWMWREVFDGGATATEQAGDALVDTERGEGQHAHHMVETEDFR